MDRGDIHTCVILIALFIVALWASDGEYSIGDWFTAAGAAVIAWQLWQNAEQAKTAFEDSMTKEYRSLMHSIPYKALTGAGGLSDEERESAKEKIYNYLDFCNEQIYLRSKNRVRKDTWCEWQKGMEHNLELPLFKEVREEVNRKSPLQFQELQKVIEKRFQTDPQQW